MSGLADFLRDSVRMERMLLGRGMSSGTRRIFDEGELGSVHRSGEDMVREFTVSSWCTGIDDILGR